MNRREALKKTFLFGGATLAAPSLLSLLQSCQKNIGTWQPMILNPEQARNISALVETILPETDTPGAVAMGVDRFIDLIIKKMMAPEEQKDVLNQIDAFIARSNDRFGNAFADMNTDQRHEMLRQEERESGTFNPQVWGATVGEQKPVGFYRQIKSLAIWGFYSSEYIGKNVLSYDPVPGHQKGCVPLSDIGNSWSL